MRTFDCTPIHLTQPCFVVPTSVRTVDIACACVVNSTCSVSPPCSVDLPCLVDPPCSLDPPCLVDPLDPTLLSPSHRAQLTTPCSFKPFCSADLTLLNRPHPAQSTPPCSIDLFCLVNPPCSVDPPCLVDPLDLTLLSPSHSAQLTTSYSFKPFCSADPTLLNRPHPAQSTPPCSVDPIPAWSAPPMLSRPHSFMVDSTPPQWTLPTQSTFPAQLTCSIPPQLGQLHPCSVRAGEPFVGVNLLWGCTFVGVVVSL